MALGNRVVEILFRAKDGMSAGLNSAQNSVGTLGSKIGALLKSTAVIAGVGAAVATLGAFFKVAAEEAIEAGASLARLQTAVTNSGQSFEAMEPSINKAIGGLTRVTRFGDDEFRDAMTVMTAKSNDAKGALGNLGLAADLAAMRGISLAEAGDLIGRVMAGQTRPLRELGITAIDASDGLEKLRARTKGYAESDLGTLAGKIAQAKANFGEFKEQIGHVVLGSTDASTVAGLLSNTLATLAEFVEKNRDEAMKFVDGLKVFFGVVTDLLSPIWALVKGLWTVIDALVPFGVIWRGLQIQMVAVGAAFSMLANVANFALGGIMQALGILLSKAAPLLDKFGFSLGAAADKLLTSGTRMVSDATAKFGTIAESAMTKIALIATQTDASEKKQTRSVRTGLEDRVDLTNELGAKRVAAAKKSADKLAELEAQAAQGSLELLSAQQREYNALVDKFQTAMRDMTKEDHAKAEQLLKTAHANLLMKWAGFGKDLKFTVQQAGISVNTEFKFMAEGAEAAGARVKTSAEKWHEFKDKAAKTAVAVRDTADAFLDFADAVGASDENMKTLVAGIGNLADAVTKIADGKVIEGLLQGAAAMTQVIGGLFGKSAEDKRLADELARTRESINRLRGTIGDLIKANTPGAIIATLKQVDMGGVDKVGGEHWTSQLTRRAEFVKALNRQGLTFDQADALMKNQTGHGISVTDKGGLTAASIKAFRDMLDASEFGQFAQDFQSQQDVSESIRRATGNDTPEAAAADLVRNLRAPGGSSFLADFLGKFLGADGSLDVTAARGGTADLLRQLNAGGFNEANFGGLTGAEFVGAINQFVDFLGSPSAPTVDGTAAISSGLVTPAFATPEGAAAVSVVLEGIERNTKHTAEGIATLVALTRDDVLRYLQASEHHAAIAAGATSATAEAIGGGRLTTMVDNQLAMTYALTAFNQGRT